MIKSFVQNYLESDAGQKAMVSAMIGCLNNQNHESIKKLLNTSSPTSNMFEYIEDLEHITNSIAEFLNHHLSIDEYKYKTASNIVLSVSRLVYNITYPIFSHYDIDKEIKEIYNEARTLNIRRKIKILTLEDFLASTDDSDSLFEEERYPKYSPTEYMNYRSEESQLKKYGYSVGQSSHLTDRKRQELLKELITTGKVSKGYVISYLKHNIQINGKKSSNEFAVSKWKDDLNFVYNL
jgi:hypothetical protein